MGTIVTISGASGSGKTILRDHLLSLGRQYRIIESVTSRPKRERDIDKEFCYLTDNEFSLKERTGEFLWVTPPIHNTRYGTLRDSVGKALVGDGVFLMIITVQYLEDLRRFAGIENRNIIGLHILSPGVEILRGRLEKRDGKSGDVEKRLEECSGWDSYAKQISEQPPIRFIENNGSVNDFFEKAENIAILD